MEKRGDDEHAIFASDVEIALRIKAVVERLPKGEERALGFASRARGVHENHGIVGGGVRATRDGSTFGDRCFIGTASFVSICGDGIAAGGCAAGSWRFADFEPTRVRFA